MCQELGALKYKFNRSFVSILTWRKSTITVRISSILCTVQIKLLGLLPSNHASDDSVRAFALMRSIHTVPDCKKKKFQQKSHVGSLA